MNGLLTIAEQMLVDRLLSNQPPISGHSKALATFIGVGGVLFAFGLAFFIYSFYLWLLNNYAPEVAALSVSGLCIGLSLVLILGVIAFNAHRRRKIQQYRQEMVYMLEEAKDLAGDEIVEQIRSKPITALMLAGAVGYIAREKFI